MTNLARTVLPVWLTLLVGASAFLTDSALAQSKPAAEPPGVDSLRVELVATQGIYRPSDGLYLRCTLTNPTQSYIDLPHGTLSGGRVRFPTDLIYGGPDGTAPLSIIHDSDKSIALTAPAPTDEAGNGYHATEPLQLAPGAVLGAEIDLRTLSGQFRYPGAYRVEWRPFGEHGAVAITNFRIEPRKNAVVSTDYGKITFELLYDTAPKNVENFLDLARTRFYDGTVFHRIVPGFIIQGGSPSGGGDGMRPDGKTVPAESGGPPFDVGVLAMSLRGNDRNSASCQFFIALDRLEELDGKYSVIGRARDDESLRTLKQISELPTNAEGKPLRPVVLRFLSLIDAEPLRGRELDAR